MYSCSFTPLNLRFVSFVSKYVFKNNRYTAFEVAVPSDNVLVFVHIVMTDMVSTCAATTTKLLLLILLTLFTAVFVVFVCVSCVPVLSLDWNELNCSYCNR